MTIHGTRRRLVCPLFTGLLLLAVDCTGVAGDDRPGQAALSGPPIPAPPAPSPQQPGTARPPVADRAAGTAEESAGERRFAGTDLVENDILRELLDAPARTFKPVGNTSVVFKMELAGRFDAAFKPASRERPQGYLHEIAAYRLARLLGLDNVPPAIARGISRQSLREGIGHEQAEQWRDYADQLLWREDGRVRGAAIFWVPGLRDLGLESRRSRETWTGWLRIGGELPEQERALAADLSNALAFDYLIGNPDRFSGGNLKGDSSGSRLYLRDHDLGFPRRLPDGVHRRILRRLLQAERFSRAFFRRLQGLTGERLRDEIALDPAAADGPILDEDQLKSVFDRRDGLWSYIASLVAVYGEDRVLAFP
jgi:hypothetical protein